MPTGKPSAAPAPHSSAPSSTTGSADDEDDEQQPGRRDQRRRPQDRRAAVARQQAAADRARRGHRRDEAGEAERADGVRGAVPVDQGDRQPVVGGALDEGEAQDQHPDEQRPRLARQLAMLLRQADRRIA